MSMATADDGSPASTRQKQAGDEPPAVLVSGEVLNAVALRAELGLAADAPVESVVAKAWRRWGRDALSRMDGCFVFALRTGTEAFLYRDPSGLRALYFRKDAADGLGFAVGLSDVLRSAGAQALLDRSSLHEFLRCLDVAAPNTFIADVRAVEPGQLLRCAAGQVETVSTDSPRSPPRLAATFAEAVDVLEGHLQHAVDSAAAGERALAAFLSGGVDSALICALALRHRPEMTALTVGFEGVRYDETPVAARIASHLGAAHRILRFGRRDYLRAFARLAEGMDQPMADPAAMATVLAFDHCREHFDVVLDGTGADEAVGAMPPRHVRLAVGYASLLPAGLRRTLSRVMPSIPGLAGYAPIVDFEHPVDTLIRWNGFTRAEIEELCGVPVSLANTQIHRTFARFPRHAHYERYSALLNAMPCDRLTQATRATDARVRYPFCNREVDGFIRQLPTEWLFLPGQPKRILRELLARYVPRKIWDIPKHGFDFPLHDFLAGDDFALVHRHVLEGRWLDRGLVRADVVRRYARAFTSGDQRLVFRIWALAVLGAWLDKHEDLI
jgi:asparagine synthase (glutamine-hydrolysing)